MIYHAEQLDALAAAYVAWLSVHDPTSLTWLGEASEGQIALPGARTGLES
jgi:hypothetical protein